MTMVWGLTMKTLSRGSMDFYAERLFGCSFEYSTPMPVSSRKLDCMRVDGAIPYASSLTQEKRKSRPNHLLHLSESCRPLPGTSPKRSPHSTRRPASSSSLP
jgi:hypothetical protein